MSTELENDGYGVSLGLLDRDADDGVVADWALVPI